MEVSDALAKLGRVLPDAKSHLEIELRYFIDERKKSDIFSQSYPPDRAIAIAKELIGKYKDKPTVVSQSINFLNNGNVKQMIFLNGEQQKDKLTHYKKTPIISPINFVHRVMPAYRLAAGFETPIEPFPIASATLARIRLRYTITLDEWQVDITLVKTISDFSNPITLKSAKNTMLFPIQPSNFAEAAPWKAAELVEFELEYIGKQFSIKSLLFADELFADTSLTTNMSNVVESSNVSNSSYQSAIYDVAKSIRPRDAYKFQHADGLKQLSNQVIELDKNMFLHDVLGQISNFYITDKIDGIRAIVYINKLDGRAISKELNKFTPDGKVPDGICILDTEEYTDGTSDGKTTYWVFDVMMYDGKLITGLPFTERMGYFEKIQSIHSAFQLKPFIRLTDKFKEQIADFKKLKPKYETDGIILTPATGSYESMTVYKYKPIDKLSVDFLIKQCPDRLLGIFPYVKKPKHTLYLLFSGMRRDSFEQLNMKLIKFYDDLFPAINTRSLPKYFPMQFQPSDFTFGYLYWDKRDDLDGEVGEFVCGGCVSNQQIEIGGDLWQLHKIRDDRKIEVLRGNYFGNNYKVAELTWMSYKEPLVIENLKFDNYFQENDNPLQKPTRNFNSYVKAQIFDQFKNTEWAMDLASGKGQDIRKYTQHGFKNVAFIEIDNVALLELIKRKHELRDSHPINILVHQLDLNANYQDNIERLGDINLPSDGVDLIMCHFAFHYLLADKKALINIARFITHYLKPGGRFVFTSFDAKEIIKLLNANAGNWTIKNNHGEIKYSIKKQYKTTLLESIGQKVDVLLPFSKEQYYSEYLVNIDYISSELEKLGFTLEIDQSFGEYLDGYRKDNTRGFREMDENDKVYSALYHVYCFYKKKAVVKVKKTG
jgi:ubiquinone/menaquinone biosynthesis C-methylase UbiE